MHKIYIKTYGCQMNERDSENVAANLREHGHEIVEEEQEADVVLLNTCSVREAAEKKALGKAKELSHRKAKDKHFAFGILGCMAQRKGESLLQELPNLDLILGTKKLHLISDILGQDKGLPRGKATVALGLDSEEPNKQALQTQKVPVSGLVNIMHGCNMNCAYCVVPQTRGKEQARSMEEIIEEIEKRVSLGSREVTLLGQIVNQYGLRQFPFVDGKSPFVQLLEKVNAIEHLKRIRFTSPHPVGFREDLIHAYTSLEKLCEHVHLPLQSGSSEVLKRMGRPYTAEGFKKVALALRKTSASLTLSTDIIVGFPQETEADFQKTLTLFKELNFEMAFIFKYSQRSKTRAADLLDNVTEEEKQRRCQILLDQLKQQSQAHNQRLLGTCQEVLVEKRAKRGPRCYTGRTRSFRKVVFQGSERLLGELVPVRIHSTCAHTLEGELL